MYKDVQLKKEALIESLMQEMSQADAYPNRDRIRQKLHDIDLYMPIFKGLSVRSGNQLDVEQINNMTKHLYMDLDIIYQILQEEREENLANFKNTVENHLAPLEEMISSIRRMHSIEFENVVPGKMAFFRDTNLHHYTENGHKKIDLGQIELLPGSKITLLTSMKNSELELSNNNSYYQVSENQATYIPGNFEIEEKNISIPDYYKLNTSFELLSSTETGHKYHILGGPQYFFSKTNNKFMSVEFNKETTFEGETDIEFYIYNASYASFSFNREPLLKNFTDNNIKINSLIRKIALRGKDLDLRLQTDGDLYATYHQGTLRHNALYHPPTKARDFLVIQEKMNRYPYNAVLTIPKDNSLEYVAIKELREAMA